MASETNENDTVDFNLFNYLFRGGNGSSETVVPSRIPVVEYLANVYNVSHKNRGIALIFNHEIFDDKSLKPRDGTEKDKKDLIKILDKLGFDVTAYDNLKFGQLHEVLQKVSTSDHTHSDCLLVCVMSHGDEGKIYARDHTYPPEVLWSPFIGSSCTTLVGKPKMFFIQACRGDKVDEGAQIRNVTKSDSSLAAGAVYRVPAMADLLVMYSTYQGHFSWRSPDKGSWFIQALVKELDQNGDRCDLLTLLTFVNRRVALFHESYVPQDHAMHKKKQICTIVSMLTRIMWFPPKKQNENSEEQIAIQTSDENVETEQSEQGQNPVMKVKAKIVDIKAEK